MKIEQVTNPNQPNKRVIKRAVISDPATPVKTSPQTPFNKPQPKLTRKQQIFVKEYAETNNGTQAALKAYGVKNENTASSIATENLRKPAIVSALVNYNELIESAIIGTVADWKDSDKPRQREIAMDAAKFVHDKIHGKAKQQIQVAQTTVSIMLNLTGDGEQPPEDML
jgi:hypothetical protein